MRTFLLLLLTCFSFLSQGQTIYVNHAATGANNGTSWTDAYIDLQTAMTSINTPSRSVWIAQGTYKPSVSDRQASFVINEYTTSLYGGFIGTETLLTERDVLANKTILSGDLSGNDDATISFTNPLRNDNSYRILTVNASYSLIDGLVFTGVHANANANSFFAFGAAIYKGAAALNLKIFNCEFKNNVSLRAGAGIHAIFSLGGTGALTVENSIFENNLATRGTSIYTYTSTNIVLTVAVKNSLFNGNKVLNNNPNDAYAGSGGWFRAYGDNSKLNATLTNNTYVNNMDSGTSSDLINKGTVGFSRDGIGPSTSLNAKVNNCIFWNNKVGPTTIAPAINSITLPMPWVVVNNSLSPDNFSTIATKNNILTADPLFVSTTNFNLTTSSPAINAGDNSFVNTTTDLNGNARIFNTTVDLGAYEFDAALSNSTFTSFNDFTMYPNPTTSLLQIKSHETINLVEIFSIDGKQVLTSKNTQLDVSHLTSGMYLVKITSETGKIGIKKLMKQ